MDRFVRYTCFFRVIVVRLIFLSSNTISCNFERVMMASNDHVLFSASSPEYPKS